MQDAALALACAMLLNPDLVPTSGTVPLPEIRQTDKWALPSGKGIDGNGRAYSNTDNAIATYTWLKPNGLMTLSSDSGPGQATHEMTHHLQNLAGLKPGKPHSAQRKAIEAQAYAAEEATRFQCLDWLGRWDKDKLGPLARKLTEGAN